MKGIPMGQLWRPDPTVPTLTHEGIKVTSLKELDEFMSTTNIDKLTVDYTNLSDIDDTMDMNLAEIGLVGAITPELPQKDFNIRTLTSEKIAELRAAGVEGAEWNATHN